MLSLSFCWPESGPDGYSAGRAQQDRRADLVLSQSVCTQSAGMTERFQELETLVVRRRQLDGLAIVRGGATERTKYSRTRPVGIDLGVRGLPILITAIAHQLLDSR